MTGSSAAALETLEKVAATQKAAAKPVLTDEAVENIRTWLTNPSYAEYVPQIAEHLAAGKLQELDDAFWTIIPFGTGGRRGRMYPIGSNAINDRTIGESAQGLATYVRRSVGAEGKQLSCGIAYDTRHRSRHFAELCAGIMVANGFRVDFLDGHRSTPELSFLVRNRQCDCGIMVTASHNPPSDNAVKVYWSSGAQVLPPHDKGIIDEVMRTGDIPTSDFQQALADGQIVDCTAETDAAYLDAVVGQRFPGPRDVRILYSPLHGVGELSVCEALRRDGFQDVEVFEPHREPNGDFPNVPQHVSNPENPAVFEAMIQLAQQKGGDLAMATDPDCDRLGCAAPLTADSSGPWGAFTGNQLAALLCDYVLDQTRRAGRDAEGQFIVTTLVTTEMLRRIADSYGVRTFSKQLVGFKWICQRLDQEGPERFLFGAEESHGYVVGQYARDKDGAVACMLMAELAAAVKAEGKSLHEKLDALYWQHGYHAEQLLNVVMPGSEGMSKMRGLMSQLRTDPPRTVGGLEVAAVEDYLNGKTLRLDGEDEPLDGPQGDLVILRLAREGNYVAVRPSGTEPKVKFYMFAYVPAEQLHNLDAVREQVTEQLAAAEADFRRMAEA